MPTEDAQTQLVVELSELVLAEVAPDELVLLGDTSDEYFADPGMVLDPRRRDEALGFGIDIALVTPFVLAVVTPVVKLLVDLAAERLGADGSAASAWVRRLLKRRDPGASGAAPDVAPALTVEQVRTVRDVAFRRARDLGLDDGRAALLADAVAGGVVVA